MSNAFEEVLADFWDRWTSAVTDRRAPLHVPVIGTSDGGLRIMVLRHVDTETGMLRFHTDARGHKAEIIGNGAAVSVLGYDPIAHVQLRGWGRGWIERDTQEADAAWASSSLSSRRCYLASEPPGSSSAVPTSGLPDWIEHRRPTEEEANPARSNFAILRVKLDRLDHYSLAASGHRRAEFVRERDDWEGCWLTP